MGSPDWVFRRIELLVIGIRHRTPVGKTAAGQRFATASP
jgi:hypothetical protein